VGLRLLTANPPPVIRGAFAALGAAFHLGFPPISGYHPFNMNPQSAPVLPLRLQLRILFDKHIALGPGKAELLWLIRETDSIAEAARRMGMSYMRAWSLLQTMNQCFRKPVVRTTRGGQSRGGARLTETGARLLELYQRLETECLVASKATREEIASRLKPSLGASTPAGRTTRGR